jgi:glucose-1-phosphate thymidylyltransferase
LRYPRDIPRCGRGRALLGDDSSFGVDLSHAIQDNPCGLADALIEGKDFIGKDRLALVLGNNVSYGQDFSVVLEKAVKGVKPSEQRISSRLLKFP